LHTRQEAAANQRGNTRANALIFLSIVEWSASRYSHSLKLLKDNAALFKKIPNPTLKGAFHNHRAMALRKLITAENRGAASKKRITIWLRPAD
jgi:hypothetical protein